MRFCESRILKIFSADPWIIQECQFLFSSYYLYMGLFFHMKASLFGKKANLKWFCDVGDRLGKWFKNREMHFLSLTLHVLVSNSSQFSNLFFFFSVSLCGKICYSPWISLHIHLLQGELVIGHNEAVFCAWWALN